MNEKSDTLADRAQSEILSRHRYFVDWFTGRAEVDTLERAAGAFHPRFTRIGPDGGIQSRSAVIDALAAAQGTHRPDFRIEIAIEDVFAVGDEAVLVCYVELQSTAEQWTARRCSALFVADWSSPEGAAWRWLQETRIDHTGA